jgi:hypothetical protein
MLARFSISGETEPWQPIIAGATPAFALSFDDTDPVPEPGTMLLVAGALTALMRKRLTDRRC